MAKNQAAWTVMIYLAGDNNLTTECMFALTEMKKAALTDNFNVVAQFDPNDPYLPSHRYEINKAKTPSLYPDIIGCARYYVGQEEVCFTKESVQAKALAHQRREARKLRNKPLEKASLTPAKASREVSNDTDTGSPITLYNFISFCLQEYPADHYMVVLSGHAGGTERDYLLKDESSARSLTFNEMKQVFRRIKKDRDGQLIDIIGMDNCLMSMAEICYELRGVAEMVVGCESFSPTSGWPYRQILERLCKDFAKPKVPKGQSLAAEAAKTIVDEYVNYYATYWVAGLSVTQSALDVGKVKELRRQINELAVAMEKKLLAEAKAKKSKRKNSFENALLLAHWEAQSYNGEQYVDVYDFCDCLERRVGPGSIANSCQSVKDFIANEFVLRSCYCGAVYQYSYGVSIYFPWSQIASSYWNLDFVDKRKGPGWGSFLEAYTHLTRRLPRIPRGAKKAQLEALNARAAYPGSGNGSVEHPMESGESVTSHRMMYDRMMYDRMMYDRMGSSNRVHSMRNPPDRFIPDECIRDAKNAWESQKILRLR